MLINCKECHKEVSPSATTCPHCGAKLKMGSFSKFVLITGGLVVAFFGFFAIKTMLEPEYVRDARAARALCEANIGKFPGFTQGICDSNYSNAILSEGRNEDAAAPIDYKARSEFDESQKKLRDELKRSCNTNKKKIYEEYLLLANQGEWWKAGLKVWNCAEATNDPDFVQWAGEATKMNSKQDGKQ